MGDLIFRSMFVFARLLLLWVIIKLFDQIPGTDRKDPIWKYSIYSVISSFVFFPIGDWLIDPFYQFRFGKPRGPVRGYSETEINELVSKKVQERLSSSDIQELISQKVKEAQEET